MRGEMNLTRRICWQILPGTLQIHFRQIEHVHKEVCYWKNHFWQNDRLPLSLRHLCLSICLSGLVSKQIQPEANMHFNTLLFSIHKAVITLRGYLITKTRLYTFDPLEPHFYIVKLGLTGVYIIFLILLKSIDCGYSLEPPRRGGSNEYPQSMFWAEIWKYINIFDRHVFVM